MKLEEIAALVVGMTTGAALFAAGGAFWVFLTHWKP
jgi:hypothetical protein